MALPSIPFPVRIVEAIWKFTQEIVFGGSIDVAGAAIFRGPIQTQNGIARWIALGIPAAAATGAVAGALASNNASDAFTVSASPDVPRNVTATFGASWDGGNVTVTGTDINGNAQTETITASSGATVAGVKIFTTVTAAAKASVGVATSSNTATIGCGTRLGIPGGMAIGPADAPYMKGVTITGGAIDTTNQGVDCSAAAPDGSSAMSVLVNQ